MSGSSLHAQALAALLNAPATSVDTEEKSKLYLEAEEAYNVGKWQECLDLLDKIKALTK